MTNDTKLREVCFNITCIFLKEIICDVIFTFVKEILIKVLDLGTFEASQVRKRQSPELYLCERTIISRLLRMFLFKGIKIFQVFAILFSITSQFDIYHMLES